MAEVVWIPAFAGMTGANRERRRNDNSSGLGSGGQLKMGLSQFSQGGRYIEDLHIIAELEDLGNLIGRVLHLPI